jgi:ferredoxin
MLTKKGYNVAGEYMICMPANFISPTPDKAIAELLKILPHKCSLISDEILEGKTRIKKPLIIDRVMLPLFAMEKLGSRVFGRTLKVSDECTGCSLCAKKCPRGNIEMREGKPKFGWSCVLCMRCAYACPEKAIYSKMPILKNAIIKTGYDMNLYIKKSQENADIDNEDNLKGLLWKGVKEYLEHEDKI